MNIFPSLRQVPPAKNGTHIPATFFGGNKFHEIIVEPPTSPEVKAIILVKFPLGSQVAGALICLWDALRLHGSATSTRGVGYRELEKFCACVEHLLRSARYPNDPCADSDGFPCLEKLIPNLTLREEIYLEARDVFFGAGALTAPARAHLEAIATTIAQQL
jgi:midasin